MLQAFYSMFLIFKPFLDKTLKIIDPKWESTIGHLGPLLNKLRKESYEKLGKEPLTRHSTGSEQNAAPPGEFFVSSGDT